MTFPAGGGSSLRACAVLAAALLGARSTAAQVLVPDPARIPAGAPFNNSTTENVDFGDVDRDGDFDVLLADGGDSGNDQNRIWINLGGLQGGIEGFLVDETAARLPAVADTSRDVELADIDADDDLDAFVSNTISLVNQPSRWWVNQGRRQGGALGFFADESAARWVGLGGPGSSLSALVVLPDGYLNFGGDADFADLDGDGDLDLFHTAYGGAFAGNIPTRVFLNDGAGFFTEFNPSGFQLPGIGIQDGDPGLWCEGTQQGGTTDTTGQFCDIATTGLDVDLGDLTGDLDLDLVLGARLELPRAFRNRLEETGTGLAFRDVTGGVFPAGYASGFGHYEQELGDLDGDGDLDLYGVNWQGGGSPAFSDVVLENDGSGAFGGLQVVPGSTGDENEADFLDYDNDGDLDVFVAAFSGDDRLYRNDTPPGGPITLVDAAGDLASAAGISTDGEACDLDGDGDYDVLVANDASGANVYYDNVSQVPDTHAPRLERLEQAPDRNASQVPTAVRVQVYDNAPYYVTWYNETWLEVRVDGGELLRFRMRPSMGQVFRGEIPGWLAGTVEYRAVSEDRYGNQGASALRSYQATGSFTGDVFCAGNPVDCPCGNGGVEGGGCENSAGTGGGLLVASGPASVLGDGLVLSGLRMPPSAPALYFQGTATVSGGFGAAFGDGLRCVAGSVRRLVTVANVGGASNVGAGQGTGLVSVLGALPPGGGRHFYQVWYRNVAPHCAPEGFNLTNALSVDWAP